MSVTETEVAELARAARLALTSEELMQYARDLEALEALASSLLLPFEAESVTEQPISLEGMRKDLATPCLPRDAWMLLTPMTKDGYFAVPRTVEGT